MAATQDSTPDNRPDGQEDAMTDWLRFLDSLDGRERYIIDTAAARFWTVGSEWFARLIDEIAARDEIIADLRERVRKLEQSDDERAHEVGEDTDGDRPD